MVIAKGTTIFGLCAALCSWSTSSMARPSEAPQLVYVRGPAECPSRERFVDEVGFVLPESGVNPFAEVGETGGGKVSVVFQREGRGYRGIVRYSPRKGVPGGPTIMDGPDCNQLARWIAGHASQFVLRAPHAALWRASAPLPLVLGEEPVAPSMLFVGSSRVVQRHMDVAIPVVLFAGMTLGFGSDPGWNIAAQAGVRSKGADLALSVSGGLSVNLPTHTLATQPIDPLLTVQPLAFDLSQITGVFIPCLHASWFRGCAVVEGGILWLQTRYRSSTLPHFAAGPSAGVEIPIAPWFKFVLAADILFSTESGNGFGHNYDGHHPMENPNAQWVESLVTGRVGGGVVIVIQ